MLAFAKGVVVKGFMPASGLAQLLAIRLAHGIVGTALLTTVLL